DPDLPYNHNCSFRITNLPDNVTEKDITDIVKNCGRVFHVSIHVGDNGAEAILIFFDYAGARRFLEISVMEPLFAGTCRMKICGQPVLIDRSPAKMPPQTELGWDVSRILRISGSAILVNETCLKAFSKSVCDCKIIETVDHGATEGNRDLEFRFSSFISGAGAVYCAIKASELFQESDVRVRFVRDPCGI
ncbi:hypothetical protein V8F20_012813, partial [Naviculisporaceae sp. PSN 640]